MTTRSLVSIVFGLVIAVAAILLLACPRLHSSQYDWSIGDSNNKKQAVIISKEEESVQQQQRRLWFLRAPTLPPAASAFVEQAPALSCDTVVLESSDFPKIVVTLSKRTFFFFRTTIVQWFYFGYKQASSINKNPVLAMVQDGKSVWCRDNYETSGADGAATGLLWSNQRLYAVFTVDGTQGTPDQDFRRFTSNGWLDSYGQGGGPKVSVILQINIADGTGVAGTFVRAQLTDGKANSLVVRNMFFDCESNLKVQCDSWYLPLNSDKTPFSEADCAPDTASPFNYTLTLSSDLTRSPSAVCRTEGQECPSKQRGGRAF